MKKRNIKNVWINFRATKELKQKFQQYCSEKETTMSKTLHNYVMSLVGDANE